MRHVVFIFIDGLGLGSDDKDVNPLARFDLPGFESLAGGQPMTGSANSVSTPELVFSQIDANLGVDGLPQSGTGQASIFTGTNCAKEAGRHYGPYPHSTSAEAIEKRNIFTRLVESGTATINQLAFANTYPARFFRYVDRTNRWTVTTRCCMSAGVHIRSTEDLATGNGVAADVTGEGLRSIDDNVTPISETEAGDNLLRLASAHRFTLFEFFHTDKAGHAMSFDRAHKRLTALDRFLAHLQTHLDIDEALLLLTSDHGNIEDLTVKTHTRNPVPFVALGSGAEHFSDVAAIDEIVDRIVSWYNNPIS
ncbi:MAG: peptidase [Rhodothermales bacterium]|nr:peptidase [Rhodothermales bacterium]